VGPAALEFHGEGGSRGCGGMTVMAVGGGGGYCSSWRWKKGLGWAKLG
jgi:hypothetical protein